TTSPRPEWSGGRKRAFLLLPREQAHRRRRCRPVDAPRWHGRCRRPRDRAAFAPQEGRRAPSWRGQSCPPGTRTLEKEQPARNERPVRPPASDHHTALPRFGLSACFALPMLFFSAAMRSITWADSRGAPSSGSSIFSVLPDFTFFFTRARMSSR